MTGEAHEDLVILNDDATAQALATLRSVVTVTHVLAPRLVLVKSGVDAAVLRSLPGVRSVYTDDVPAGVRFALTPSELLFVDGWGIRRHGKAHRLGQGLPWDTPGFLPPDPPPDGVEREGLDG
jgi:hypothetical protein